MRKLHKWNKQKPSKMPELSTRKAAVSNRQTSSPTPSCKQMYNSPHSVTISTSSNDIYPYQATITTTAINGCKKKESENNSVIVKTDGTAGDILDLSPNKNGPISFAFNKLKDISVICNNTSQDNNTPPKTVRLKHV